MGHFGPFSFQVCACEPMEVRPCGKPSASMSCLGSPPFWMPRSMQLLHPAHPNAGRPPATKQRVLQTFLHRITLSSEEALKILRPNLPRAPNISMRSEHAACHAVKALKGCTFTDSARKTRLSKPKCLQVCSLLQATHEGHFWRDSRDSWTLLYRWHGIAVQHSGHSRRGAVDLLLSHAWKRYAFAQTLQNQYSCYDTLDRARSWYTSLVRPTCTVFV